VRRFRHCIEFLSLALLLAALVGLFSALNGNFWSASTFNSVANRIPPLALTSLGMTFVLVAGSIDLSVGSVSALAGAVFGASLTQLGLGAVASAAAGVGAGLLCGAFNGLLVNALRMPSFIVTLGLLEIARGLAYLVTHSQTVYLGDRLGLLEAPVPMLGASVAFVLALLLTLAAHLVLTRTVFGRQVIVVGTNEEAARLAGIPVPRIRAAVFLIAGGLAGLAGLCNLSHLGAADPNGGTGLELSAIAAAVIGGTSLMGGRGSMLSSLMGVLIIATLEAGLAQVGVSEPVKRVVTGLVIVGAVGAEAVRSRLAARTRS
jgi:ribose transport system permease protein